MTEAALGITHSISGQPWHWRRTSAEMGGESLAPDDLVTQLLLARGVARDDLDRQRVPTLRGFMPDPSLFRDMDAAAARLADAVEAREAVTVFGDYDVDGATSAALLVRLLRALDVPVVHVNAKDRASVDALAPWPEGVAKVVDQLKATGTLRNVLADFRPHVSGDQKLSFAANLQQVGFNATHGAPAARNVSGLISGDLGKGELRLDSKDFMLHLDPIFAKPWQYQQANALLTWTLSKDTFTLIAPYIKVLGEEGKIAADFLIRIHLDHSQEDYMDLRVGLTDGDGRFTPKYLPEVLSPALTEWLSTAII